LRITFFSVGCGVGILSGLAIGLTLAFFTKSFDSPNDTNQSVGRTITDTTEPSDRNGGLQEFLAIKSPLVLDTSLRNSIAGKNVPYLRQLLHQTDEFGKHNTIAQHIQDVLIEQIAQVDPETAVELILKYESTRWPDLLQVIFQEWASHDLSWALQSAATLLGSARKSALSAIVESTSDLTELHELADLIGISSELRLLVNELEALSLLSQPIKAIDFVFSDEFDDVEQEELLVSITESWASTSGSEFFPDFLTVIRERFDQTSDSDYATKLMLKTLVAKATSQNPEYMRNLLMLESEKFQRHFESTVFESWSRQDLPTAIEALEDFNPLELRNSIFHTLMVNWAYREPRTVLNNIQVVMVEHRTDVIAIAISELFQRYGMEEALSNLTTMEEKGENVRVAMRLFSQHWASKDPHAVIDWVLQTTTEDENEKNWLLRATLPKLAAVDSERALAIAQEYDIPGNTNSLRSLEVTVSESVAKHHDIEITRDFLSKVSEQAQWNAYSSVGRELINSDSVTEALRLGEDLPEHHQHSYFRDLTFIWFYTSPESFTTHISDLSRSHATVVAQRALEINNRNPMLSDNEVAQLKTFVDMK